MRDVADVGTEEPVQRPRGPPGGQRRDPVRDRGEEHRDRPEEHPDEVRDREDQPEEDRQAVAPQVVLDDELDGVLAHDPETML